MVTLVSELKSSRREFLKAVALGAGGLAIGFSLPAAVVALATEKHEAELTAWVRIAPDNQVTIVVSQAELGQGISTTLPAILADELGARWESVKLETASFAPAYRNPERKWMFTGN